MRKWRVSQLRIQTPPMLEGLDAAADDDSTRRILDSRTPLAFVGPTASVRRAVESNSRLLLHLIDGCSDAEFGKVGVRIVGIQISERRQSQVEPSDTSGLGEGVGADAETEQDVAVWNRREERAAEMLAEAFVQVG